MPEDRPENSVGASKEPNPIQPSTADNSTPTRDLTVADVAAAAQPATIAEVVEIPVSIAESEAQGDSKSDIAAAYAKKLADTAIQLAAR